jgi:hypothetical protein
VPYGGVVRRLVPVTGLGVCVNVRPGAVIRHRHNALAWSHNTECMITPRLSHRKPKWAYSQPWLRNFMWSPARWTGWDILQLLYSVAAALDRALPHRPAWWNSALNGQAGRRRLFPSDPEYSCDDYGPGNALTLELLAKPHPRARPCSFRHYWLAMKPAPSAAAP